MMSWGRHMTAPSGGAPMTSWEIVRPWDVFGQFSKPDWVSTVMSFEYLDNWQPKWNIVNLSQQKVKVKFDFIITQNKCSDLFLSKWYHNIVRMNVFGMSVDVPPRTLMWNLTYLCLLTDNYTHLSALQPTKPPPNRVFHRDSAMGGISPREGDKWGGGGDEAYMKGWICA